jgi:hypothetical protein
MFFIYIYERYFVHLFYSLFHVVLVTERIDMTLFLLLCKLYSDFISQKTTNFGKMGEAKRGCPQTKAEQEQIELQDLGSDLESSQIDLSLASLYYREPAAAARTPTVLRMV